MRFIGTHLRAIAQWVWWLIFGTSNLNFILFNLLLRFFSDQRVKCNNCLINYTRIVYSNLIINQRWKGTCPSVEHRLKKWTGFVSICLANAVNKIHWPWSSNELHWFIMSYCIPVNSMWPSDTMWWQRSGSTLAQVMACCLTVPSHYLYQCWLIFSEVQWHWY